MIQVVLGEAHPLTESCTFCPFFAGLPYVLASAIIQVARSWQPAVDTYAGGADHLML